jgi:hypothetical protein
MTSVTISDGPQYPYYPAPYRPLTTSEKKTGAVIMVGLGALFLTLGVWQWTAMK